MKVAAYQIRLSACRSIDAIPRIAEKVRWCELNGVDVLCCPEGALGGLADYVPVPADIAVSVESGQLLTLLRPLVSDHVTTILGFTELGSEGLLYNSAAILHRGTVHGVYRKLHPAINKSVYAAGDQRPVFTRSNVTFGILLCRDSMFSEPARTMASQGATRCSSQPTLGSRQARPGRNSSTKLVPSMWHERWRTLRSSSGLT